MPATYAEHAKGKSANRPASRTAPTTTPSLQQLKNSTKNAPGVVRNVAKARNHIEKKQLLPL